MPLYALTYTETVRVAVEAPNESAAEQAWIDSAVDGGDVLSCSLLHLGLVERAAPSSEGAQA